MKLTGSKDACLFHSQEEQTDMQASEGRTIRLVVLLNQVLFARKKPQKSNNKKTFYRIVYLKWDIFQNQANTGDILGYGNSRKQRKCMKEKE